MAARERGRARPRRAGRPAARRGGSRRAARRGRRGRAAGRARPWSPRAHRAEQAAHLGRAPCGRCCSTPRSASRSSGELGRQPVPDGADLQHHHADRVGDDVVQLAGDPRALLGDRDARRASRSRSATAARSAASACAARSRRAKPPSQAIANSGRDEDEVAGGAVGVVEGDDRGAAERRSRGRAAPARSSRRLPSRNAAAMPAA